MPRLCAAVHSFKKVHKQHRYGYSCTAIITITITQSTTAVARSRPSARPPHPRVGRGGPRARPVRTHTRVRTRLRVGQHLHRKPWAAFAGSPPPLQSSSECCRLHIQLTCLERLADTIGNTSLRMTRRFDGIPAREACHGVSQACLLASLCLNTDSRNPPVVNYTISRLLHFPNDS